MQAVRALLRYYWQKGGRFHMGKFLRMLTACLLLCAHVTAAMANQWGLTGGIYDIVADNDEYDAYSADAETGNEKVLDRHVDIAIMTSRYHSQLIAAVRQGKTWKAETVSTAAVYQPGDQRGIRPELTHTYNGFTLTYDGRETYTFMYMDGRYVLWEVFFNTPSNYGDNMLWDGEGYLYWESGPAGSAQPIGDALWRTELISLDRFNIAQLPRSMADVRRMNSVSRAFGEMQDRIAPSADWPGEKKGRKLAVYAAPDAKAWRAANGKASVSTGGRLRIYGEYDGWTMIEYEVSLRTSRIGFVKGSLMDAPEALEIHTPIQLVTARDTFLTDDPHVSQYPQMTLPAGTKVQGLSLLGDYYALVSYPDAGQPVWGFVPLRDLTFPDDGTRWDVMDRLTGKWGQSAGADTGANLRVLFSDGSFRAINKDEDFNWLSDEYGQYRITACTDGAHYAEPVLYEIAFTYQNGAQERYGLLLHEDGSITLVTDDSVSWYERIEYSTFGNG